MVDQAEFLRWRAEADAGLEVARESRRGERHNWTCFLAEQAAQLAVKALLHGLGTGPWGHDLVMLGRALSDAVAHPLPEPLQNTLARLSKLYIPTRYPDAHPEGSPGDHYTAEEADQALDDAAMVIATIDDLWQQLVA